jgi:PAS domain S-box-containing protein
MNALTLRPRTERERIDWDSLFLLLMLIVPAAVMWIILILWPGVVWMAPTLHTAIEALGSFTLLLLAVFFIARYRGRPGTLFISAGLGGMAVLAGFLMAAAPSSNEYAWLNSISGIVGGALFLYATVTSYRSIPTGIGKRAWWLLGGSAGLAFAAGLCTIIFSRLLPPMMSGTRFTGIAWTVNALPIALFLVTGIGLFAMYRRTAERGLFVFASIVVFLFQAREVYYLAAVWTPVWWFWQGLCLAVYFCVLFFVLKGYIKTSDSLTGEIVERRRVEDALRAAEQDWRNSFNSIDDIMVIIDRDFVIQRINETGLRQLGREPGLVIGQKCPRLFHGLDRPPKDCPCRSSFRSGKVATMEQTDKHSGRAFAVKGAPICTESKPEKCVCLMRDITKEIKARTRKGSFSRN